MGNNRAQMIAKFGSERLYLEFMRSIAKQGGKVKTSKGRYGGKNAKM